METDGKTDRYEIMMEKKTSVNNIVVFLLKIHATCTGLNDSWQHCQAFMPLGVIKLSLLSFIRSIQKCIIQVWSILQHIDENTNLICE